MIEAGTLPSQRTQVGTLETIARASASRRRAPPALLVVGSVVELRTKLEWFEKLPLFGQRIVITRPRRRRVSGGGRSRDLGGRSARWRRPSKSGRSPIPAPLDRSIDRLAEYEWLVFTSANGVRFFLRRLAGARSRPACPGPSQTRGNRSHDRGGPRRLSPAGRSRAGLLSLRGPGGGPGPRGPRPQDPARPSRSRTNAPQG